jgi:hypothetical protein
MKRTADQHSQFGQQQHIDRDSTETTKVAVRRISWQELWRLRPDLRPANDDRKKREAA